MSMSRIERLAALLEEPLLVTSAVNVRYLTGLASSNAALLVEPDGEATLFTDFRYAQRARRARRRRASSRRRARSLGDLATRLAGRTIGFEAHVLTVAALETLRGGGVELVPHARPRRAAARGQGAGELESAAAAAAISDAVFGALAEERFVGRTERELAWRDGASSSTSTAVASSRSTRSSPPAENGASPHSEQPRRRSPGEHARDRRRRLPRRRLLPPTARARSRPASSRTSSRESTTSASRRSSRGSRRWAPGVTGREADAAARDVIEAAGYGEQFGHGLGHGVGLEVHEAPAARPESTDTLEPGNVVSAASPGSTCRALGGVRIEDMVLVTDDGRERLTHARKELVTVS